MSPDQIERIAQIVDPEAFGLPAIDESTEAGGYLTDRDVAREKAARIIRELVGEK